MKPKRKQLRQSILKLKHKFEKEVKNGGEELFEQENEAVEKEKSPKKENAAKKRMPEETLYSHEEFVKGECSYQMGYACIDTGRLILEALKGSS